MNINQKVSGWWNVENQMKSLNYTCSLTLWWQTKGYIDWSALIFKLSLLVEQPGSLRDLYIVYKVCQCHGHDITVMGV